MPDDALDQSRSSRRDFLAGLGRGAALLGLGGLAGAAAVRSGGEELLWQIDPFKCVKCGRCATHCVLDVSAVKCYQDFPLCGYCQICFGFVRPDRPDSLKNSTAAENQLCPTAAITRRWIESVYYEYTIDETLCNGCAKCVDECERRGNASFYLQVRHDRCLNCSECSIAIACPADAFVRLPAHSPYLIKSQTAHEA